MISKNSIIILILVFSVTLAALGFIAYAMLTAPNDPVVKTKVGTFQGLHAPDGNYDMYLGIPYAQVNVSNVFGPAITYQKLDNVFKADTDAAICPQFDEFSKIITGTLDCLRLNVYTPKITRTKNRHPVIVFIHGGDYKSGFGRKFLYGPKYLMRHGIILVTVNYRLGPYGFLNNIPNGSANQGLKDQVLALKWIKDNIVHFGGAPNKITIAGFGSGGESVNLHLKYDEDELFQNAIIESGVFLNHKEEEEEESAILELAEELDFKTDYESVALNFLNKQNVKSVIAASMKLHLNYGPCIEKFDDAEAYITRNKSNINIKRVRLLVGQSNKETLRQYAHRNVERREIDNLFKMELQRHFDLNEDQLRQMEKHVHNSYISDERDEEKTKQKIVDFTSDLHHNYPTKRMIENYIDDNPKAIYYSVFSYTGGRNFMKSIYNISMDGAAQGDVLGYLFDTPYVNSPDDEDELVIKRMTTLWTNFVKYGNPTPVKTGLLPVKWEPVVKGKLNYLEVNLELTSKVTPFPNRTAFWDVFYKDNGQNERVTKRVEPWRV